MAREKPLPSKITERQRDVLRWIARHYSFKSGWYKRLPSGRYSQDYPYEECNHFMIAGTKGGPSTRNGVRTTEKERVIYVARKDWRVVMQFLDHYDKARLINVSARGMQWVADGPFNVWPRRSTAKGMVYSSYRPHSAAQSRPSNADPILDAA